MSRLKLIARGKINLALDVLNRRPDGYHEVSMVMQTISMGDELFMETVDDQTISLTVSDPRLGGGPENLAYRAADRFIKKYELQRGVRIHIEKNIPIAAGLGGGSADAAGVLVGLNRLWRLGLDDAELSEIALPLGADVPFCIKGGTILAEGIGEKLTSLPPLPKFGIVLAKPTFPVSTADVYKGWDRLESPEHPDTQGVAELIRTGDFKRIPECWGNALEPVTFKLRPELAQVFRKLKDLGYGLRMSGSGPTLFLWDLPSDSEARRVVNHCRQLGVWAEALYTYDQGITFLNE